MNLYNENNIEFFNFFFTSIYKFSDTEKFKNKTYQDMKNFVDNWLQKDKAETEIIAKLFLSKCISISQHQNFQYISFEDHKNLLKISEYLEEKIEPRIIPLELHVNVDSNSFVYLFRLLQENKIINNTKPELENILFALLNNRVTKSSINSYLYSEHQFPETIFPKCKWNDLF